MDPSALAIKFGKKINIIRNDIERILRKRIWDLEKTIAFVIFIIDKCHLRVGNEKYKDDNESYGITTLEKQHIIIKSTSIYINFIGKKGIENSCRFRESRMLSLFKSLNLVALSFLLSLEVKPSATIIILILSPLFK